MKYTVRIINGSTGGAIAVRNPVGKERKVAVFSDAGVRDLAAIGDTSCVIISDRGRIAILDMDRMEVVKRAKLSFHPDNVIFSSISNQIVCFTCKEMTLCVVDFETLKEVKLYNLAQRREDGLYNLIHKTPDELKSEELWFHKLPICDAPLRRIRLSKNVSPKFSSDGRLVVPTEYHENEPASEHISKHANTSLSKPIARSFFNQFAGVAYLNLNEDLAEFKTLRQTTETGLDCCFSVRSISPDASKAILHSSSPIVTEADKPKSDHPGLARLFGRRREISWAYGVEIWNLASSQPILEKSIGYHSFQDNVLLHPTTLELFEHNKAEFQAAVDLMVPGVVAVLSGQKMNWEQSVDKRREDEFYMPGETGQEKPSYQAPYWRVDDPILFGAVMRRLLSVHLDFPQKLPWSNLTNRQRHFLFHLIKGWGFHAKTPIMSLAWTDNPDRFVILGRNGIVLEISCANGPGPAFQITDRPKTIDSLDWKNLDAKFEHLGNRFFAVSYYGAKFEFELPESHSFGPENLDKSSPLPIQIITDIEQHRKDVKSVDHLISAIRPGYVIIKSSTPDDIVDGVQKLAAELREIYHDIVIENRWVPSLWIKNKPIEEKEFCDILCSSGSEEAISALNTLLEAYLEATKGEIQAAWHLDDETPSMGHVATALARMCNPLPKTIMAFVDQRDVDHDNWTIEAFSSLNLPPTRLSAPDFLPIRIRLAIQAPSIGYLGTFFELLELKRDLNAINEAPNLANEYARLIIEQAKAEAKRKNFRNDSEYVDIVQRIIDNISSSLVLENPGEAALAAALNQEF